MATGVIIVKQYERMIKFRLGQYVGHVKGPGFHFLIPFLETGRVIDIREVPERVVTQQYITKDNVVVDMDFVLYYRVVPEIADRAVLEIADFRMAVRNLAMAELRSIIGNVTLGAVGAGTDPEPATGGPGREHRPVGDQGAGSGYQRDRPSRWCQERYGTGEVGVGYQDG